MPLLAVRRNFYTIRLIGRMTLFVTRTSETLDHHPRTAVHASECSHFRIPSKLLSICCSRKIFMMISQMFQELTRWQRHTYKRTAVSGNPGNIGNLMEFNCCFWKVFYGRWSMIDRMTPSHKVYLQSSY